jgi:hypothetical protein
MKTSNIVLRFLTVMLLLVSVSLAQPVQKKKASFWQRLLRFAGISATPSAQKAPGDEVTDGDIWLVQLDSSQASRLTHEGGYRSPIFLSGDQKILALKSEDVMEIGLTGAPPKKRFGVKSVVKLIGVNMDDPNSILVLLEDPNRNPGLGLLTLNDGRVTIIPPEGRDEYRRALTHAKSWERVYGSTKTFVKTEVKTDIVGAIEWSDVYVKRDSSEPRNVSRCDGKNCGQPSLSQNGRTVTFIKSQE